MLTHESLRQFTGTEGYHRWSPLFRRHCLTDGAQYLAEQAGAYWLMDAIASHHQTACQKDHRCRDIQFWTLKTDLDKHTCVLQCWGDSGKGEKPVVTQEIEYTDFPLEEIKLFCQPLDETNWVIMLPSEY